MHGHHPHLTRPQIRLKWKDIGLLDLKECSLLIYRFINLQKSEGSLD